MDANRIRARDAALLRLRRLTAALLAGAGALALLLTVVAAKAFPGRSTHATTRTVTRRASNATRRTTPTQTPPPLVGVGSQAQPQPQSAAPAPSPAPSAAPPAVVSGGS